MEIPSHIEYSGDRPTCVFDGECGFCRRSVEYLRNDLADDIRFEPYQDLADEFEQIPSEAFEEAVFFIAVNGNVYRGAEAIYQLLDRGNRSTPLWLYRNFSGIRWLSDQAYRWVANNRPLVASFARFLYGEDYRPTSWVHSRNVFLKALGIIIVVAFASLLAQVHGLFGSEGIAPIAETMSRIQEARPHRYVEIPTLFWFGTSDLLIESVCWLGIGAGGAVFFGLFSKVNLAVAFVAYLSFVTVGQPFLQYQWDILLLEVVFFSIFLAPAGLSGIWPKRPRPSILSLWLLHWILFRLMLLSGLVKIGSGDETWANLTALDYHFWTQPLPTWTSYYLASLPDLFLEAMTGLTLFIELLIPFLLLMPRRFRRIGAIVCGLLQIAILLSGNYGFFNWLTLVLCLVCLDDAVYRGVFKRFGLQFETTRAWSNVSQWHPIWGFVGFVGVALVAFIGVVKGVQQVGITDADNSALQKMVSLAGRYKVVNNYGLFAVMTTERPEIIVQGSRQGNQWETYEFKWKPGDLDRRPLFVAPHQPRLDWQMWFAALRGCRGARWILPFQKRLLEGSQSVESLLASVPFDEPPRYIRTVKFKYRFSSEPGQWWERRRIGTFCPPLTLQSGRLRKASL